MLNKSRLVALFLALPLVAFFIGEAYFSYRYFFFKRQPYHFILPDHETGFFLVVWGHKNCQNNNEFELSFENHTACSKHVQQQGFATDVYRYQTQNQSLYNDPKSGLNRIWNEEFLADKNDSQISYYLFYVGTEKQTKKQLEQSFKQRLFLIEQFNQAMN